MISMCVKVLQSLTVSAPQDEQQIEDVINAIKNPDPYLCEEPVEMEFSWHMESVSTQISNGELQVSRTLVFDFKFKESEETMSWLIEDNFADEDESKTIIDALGNASLEILLTTLVGDFEGSFIDDEMVDYENVYELSSLAEL